MLARVSHALEHHEISRFSHNGHDSLDAVKSKSPSRFRYWSLGGLVSLQVLLLDHSSIRLTDNQPFDYRISVWEVLTVHGNEWRLFNGPRHSPYSYFLFRVSNVAAVINYVNASGFRDSGMVHIYQKSPKAVKLIQ